MHAGRVRYKRSDQPCSAAVPAACDGRHSEFRIQNSEFVIDVNRPRFNHPSVWQVLEAVRHPPGLDGEAEGDGEGAHRQPEGVVEKAGDAVDIGVDPLRAQCALNLVTESKIGVPELFLARTLGSGHL